MSRSSVFLIKSAPPRCLRGKLACDLELDGSELTPGSKLVLQIEEVVQGSTALLPDVSVLLSDLAASVSNAVDLAVQVSRISTGRSVSCADFE